MTQRLFVVTAAAQAGGLALGTLVASLVGYQGHTVVFVAGAILATEASAYLRRAEHPVSARLSALVGLETAAGTVLGALAMKAFLGWIPVPEVTLPISAIGTFMFPVLLSKSLIGHFRPREPRRSHQGD